ncbi:MAG TPA: DUF4139 domain-containing protein [Rhizomicrobium sp.]|nr:DUF4139 domain-containing protein [Rhizomicrobium sp.]
MRFSATCIAAITIASAAHAADPSQKLSITVYNNNLALVQDERRLDVPAGRTRLEFKDVSASIKPETVALSGAGLGVVEQNFDYDLLTPSKMMEKAVGHEIEIVRTIPGTGQQTHEKAIVLSVNSGVVLKIGNRIEVLSADGLPTQVIFNSIPENLRAQPTLSVTVDAAQGGPHDVTLSYLTTGLSWKADYVALFDEKQNALNLQGWITLTNKSGTSYKDAKTQLVAGDVNITGEYQNNNWQPPRPANHSAGTQASNEASIADYNLYTLPERVTVAEAQTKQVGFLDQQGVSAKKVYEYRTDSFASSEEPSHADVDIDFSNRGKALPVGTMRVYIRDQAGEPKFAGEDNISHTPAGSELSVKIGEAFDVTVQPTLVSSEKLSRWRTRYTMSYLLRNAKPEPVTVELRQGGLWRDGKVETESFASRRIDANTLGWSAPVPANGETTLTFTVDSGD